jgi:hypothetical protein
MSHLIRYYRNHPVEDFNMDDVQYDADPDEGKKSDPAILEKLLANPSAKADILSGSNDKYDWIQNGNEVEVYVHLEPDVSRKEVKCIIEKDSLTVEVRGESTVLLLLK